MTEKSYEIITALLFAILAVVHLMRFAMGWAVQVGTLTVPMWASLLAIVVAVLFALWGLTLARRLHSK